MSWGAGGRAGYGRVSKEEAAEKAVTTLEVSVFGPTRLALIDGVDGTRRPVRTTEKEATFVAYLVVTGQPQARASLAELFWPDRPAEQSLANLRVLLSRLRKKLGGHLAVERDAVALVDAGADLWAIERLIGTIEDDPVSVDLSALDTLASVRGVRLADGAVITDSLAFDDWLITSREAFDRRLAEGRRVAIELAWRRRDHALALRISAALVEADLLDEQACRRHMRLLARVGRPTEALRAFEACGAALRQELGVDPATKTTELAEALADRTATPSTVGGSGNRLEARARAVLLDRLERFWIDQVLDRATPKGGAFRLRVRQRPDLIASAWSDLGSLPSVDSALQPEPTTSPLMHFQQSGRALLVAGAPGAGKTFRLLELARAALAVARDDADAPVPVVLHLGSWSSEGPTDFLAWVREEIRRRYHVPRGVLEPWLHGGTLMLLLDGLDELSPALRRACVEAINRSRQDAGLIELAVCCRTEACLALLEAGEPLGLEAAIELLPLTPWQVEQHLDEHADAALGRLRAGEGAWRELLANPLMLSLASDASPPDAATVTGLEVPGTTLRGKVVAGFVDRMLARAPAGARTPLRKRLHALARGMAGNRQAVFQIDALQPAWLPDAARNGYLLVSRLACVGSLSLVAILLALWAGQLSRALPIILVVGVLGGFLLAGIDHRRFAQRDASVPSARFGWSVVAFVLITAMTLLGGWSRGHVPGFPAVFQGVGFASLLVWRPRGLGWESDIEPVVALAWSARRACRGLLVGLLFGAAFGNLMPWLLSPDEVQPSFSFALGVALGPAMTWGLILALLTGLYEVPTENLESSNLGIHTSMRNAIFGALLMSIGLGLGLLVAMRALRPLIEGLDLPLFFALRHSEVRPSRAIFFAMATVFGGFSFLWYGGLQVLKHAVLRLFLWRTGVLPLRVARFLADAADLGLLRHQATGTIFRHGAVLEHFAGDGSSHPSFGDAEPTENRSGEDHRDDPSPPEDHAET